jgi:HSP20 family protein
MKTRLLTAILIVARAIFIFKAGYFLGGKKHFKKSCVAAHAQKKHGVFTSVSPAPQDITGTASRAQKQSQVSGKVVKGEGYYFATAMTTKENEQSYTVNISLPGVDKKAISVEVSGRQMIIQARQKNEYSLDKGGFHKEEMSATNFIQTITLPEVANSQNIKAEYNWEVLTITIPKEKKATPILTTKIKVPIK